MTDAHDPHEHPSAKTARSSALALLASGNSLESVAHVLGVPVDTLQSWAAQGVAASPAPEHVPPEVVRPWLSFPTTTTYALGPTGKYVLLGMAPFLAGCPLLAWILASVNGTGTSTFAFCAVLAVPCLALAVCAIRVGNQSRFEMRPHSIARFLMSEPKVLAYSDIIGLTATRQSRSASYQVVLHARAGTPSLTINPEDAHLRDPDLLAWLNAIPQQGGVPIRRKDDDEAETGFLAGVGSVLMWLVGGLAALMLLMMLRMPIATARSVFFGYPSLQQLSLTEGTLTGVTSCTYSRGGSYVVATVQTATGEKQERLDCIIGRSALAGHGPHHAAIYRDQRHFADGAVRQVELDGQVLQDYAASVVRSRRTDPAMLVWQLLMAAMLALMFYGLWQSRRQDD
jgi:hypothetical protein